MISTITITRSLLSTARPIFFPTHWHKPWPRVHSKNATGWRFKGLSNVARQTPSSPTATGSDALHKQQVSTAHKKKKKNYNHPRCHQIGPVVITYIQTQWSRSHLSRVGSAQVVSDKEMLGSATTQLQYQTNANNRNLSAAVRTSVAPESGESIARNLHSLKELLTTVGGKGKRP